MRIPFAKMHGAGNDFVVVDHRERFLPEKAAPLFARLCDRRRGIGADGVLLLERDAELDGAMRYFNADGRLADYCGNGARCLARFALDLGLGRDGELRLRTGAGPQRARALAGGRGVAVEFGFVQRASEPIELEACGRSFRGRRFVAGVPHFVVPEPALDRVPLAEWGAALRGHGRFAPEGANVDFVALLERDRVAMRTYERGVEGETLACGSGAIASALWAALEGSPSPVRVATRGGDELQVSFLERDGGWDVTLSGPVETSFRGEWNEAALTGAATEV